MPDLTGFIPGIHNYCDRWCERCEYTTRCSSFAMEAELTLDLDASADPVGDAVRSVAIALAEAKRMLLEKAEEMGIDLETEASRPEITQAIERSRAVTNSAAAVSLAKSYALETRSVVDASGDWAGDAEADPMIGEMLAIVQWYLFLIPAKVHRGYHGALDLDGLEDHEQIEDPQSDANGSIKIAIIAIERSVLAWTYLMNPSNAAVIRPVVERLGEIKALIETKFPNARDFIRPGFDEIEMVM